MNGTRLPYQTLLPSAFQALLALERRVQGLTLGVPLLEPVKVRARQLNGCGFCLDRPSKDARKVGVSQRQLCWSSRRGAGTLFTPRRQAVLKFEAVTLQAGVPDAPLGRLRPHFCGAGIIKWTMAVITVNAWNRMGVVSGLHPA